MATDWPDFINKDLVERGLKKYHNDDKLDLTGCDISLVVAKGDNYSSIMCRAKCKYTTKEKTIEKSIIIKGLPTASAALKYVKKTNAFGKECIMLAEVLPEIQNILKTININEPLAPEYIYSEEEPYYVLFMEDLSEQQFANKNRHEGLTFEEGSKVLNTIASYHAATMVYFEENPDVKKIFPFTVWSRENRENLDDGLKIGIDTIIKNIDSRSDKKWSEKIENIQKRMPDVLYDLLEYQNPKYPQILNHGDLWSNNVMFREINGLELRLVDFQLGWINSPIFDVMYFIFTSMKKNVRFNNMNDLLKVYHTSFVSNCKKLNLEINYNFDDLKQDLNDNLLFAFVMFAFVFPIIVAPPSQAIDTDMEFSDAFKDNPVFTNQLFIDNFLLGLDFFEENGLFVKYN